MRVPDLDGRVRPLPKPALNLRDSGLVKALDEVAHIGSLQARELRYGQATEGPSEFESPARQTEVIEPLPLPDVVPVDPPLPAEIVSGLAAPLPVKASETGVVGDNGDHAAMINELAAISALPRDQAPARSRIERREPNRRSPLFEPIVVAAIVAVAVVAAGAGYWTAAFNKPHEVGGIAANGANHPANESEKPVVGRANGQDAASVRGRITEKIATGESRTSVGAKIIAFPTTPPGTATLPAAGFRATASDAEFQAAQAAMRQAGGDVAVADNEGNFELKLPAPGTYSLLVLSRFQSRESQRPVEAALKQLLETNFDRPESLPGEARYHFGRIRYRGSGTEVWDHSFEGE
ncbi:MAG: hypothetical protein WD648_03630 [Planctomycetaceae bacterium]